MSGMFGDQNPTAASTYVNYGTAVTANIKASAGSVYSIYHQNDHDVVTYVGIYNKTSAAATNDVPLVSFRTPALGSTLIGSEILTLSGISCSTGITFGISFDKTKYSAADPVGEHVTMVVYK